MKNLVANIASFFKQVRVERILVVLAAGFVMLVSTACQPPAPVSSGQGSYHEKVGANQPTELYDPIEQREGGMNVYSDTDPRYQRRDLGNEIEGRVYKAKENLNRSIDDAGDYARNYREGAPLGERVRNITDNVGKTVDKVTDEVSEGTERGSRNLKVNASRAERNAGEAVNGVTEDLKDNTRDVTRKAQRTLDNASKEAGSALRDRA